jgi:hypothetical protein
MIAKIIKITMMIQTEKNLDSRFLSFSKSRSIFLISNWTSKISALTFSQTEINTNGNQLSLQS